MFSRCKDDLDLFFYFVVGPPSVVYVTAEEWIGREFAVCGMALSA